PYVRIEVEDLAGLARGDHDTRVRRMFETFASFTDQGGGRRIIIDVLPEANNDHRPYGDDPSRFKTAFRRVVEAARSELGHRVRTVFSGHPRMSSNRHSHATWGAGGYRLFWPGGAHVDVAGISGYDDRAGTDVSLYRSAVSEMASVAGPGTPVMISLGGAPNRPSEAAQIAYVGALADLAASHEQMMGIQWEDRLRGDADMRVSNASGLQTGFAAASAPARSDGVDWLFSSTAKEWSAERRTVIPFDDSTSSVFVTDIRWLAATGITKGCASRKFCPDDLVTRGQMAAFLSRALDLPSPAQTVVFDDSRGHTFASEISKLAHAGITLGCNPPENDRFCPDDNVTRAQMAAFMVRAGLTD
ncbi:MAG TPA: S-layer homology domain-containing protein, partial [Acidimicrobiia bacterium]|nr:S-layer homology domain-containing protein [Acidimicrobiia bacterium]